MNKIFYTRAEYKHWLVKDSLAYRMVRSIRTRQKQLRSENSKLLKGLKTIGVNFGLRFLKASSKDPYDIITVHQQVARHVSKKIAPLPDEYGNICRELEEAQLQKHALSKQEKKPTNKGEAEESTEVMPHDLEYKPVQKQEKSLSYPQEQAPPYAPYRENCDPEDADEHLHIQGHWHGTEAKSRILAGIKWPVFPPMMEYSQRVLSQISKTNLLSYYSGGKKFSLLLLCIIIELGEIFFVTMTVGDALGIPPEKQLLMACVPLALAMFIFFMSKQWIGDWLRGSIHFKWKRLPFWIVFAFLCLAVNTVTVGLMAIDNQKENQFLVKAAAERAKRKKEPKTFSFGEKPKTKEEGGSKALVMPERSFGWANTVLYFLLGISLAASAGVTSALLFHISEYRMLGKKIKQLQKRGNNVRTGYDEGIDALDKVFKSMETCISNYGFIQYCERLLSWNPGAHEAKQMMNASSLKLNGSHQKVDALGIQSINKQLQQELS